MSSPPSDPESRHWVNAITKEVEQLRALGVPIPPKNDDEPMMEYFLKLTHLLAKERTARSKPEEGEEVSRVSPRTPSVFWRRLKKIVLNAIAEGVNTLFFILLLAGARWMVEHLFRESMFFNHIPVRYLFDVGDIAVIGRFIWNTLKGEE